MQYRTQIEIPRYPFKISYKDSLFWIGSCFANNTGEAMKLLKFNSMVNPFGAMYNPCSILTALDLLMSKTELNSEDLFLHNELWSSFFFHGSFSDIDKCKAIKRMNDAIKDASNVLYSCSFLFVTFGTAYVYRLKNSGKIVGNCHKLPASHFLHERLTVEEITELYETFVTKIVNLLPHLRIIFSLSPVRHFGDGAHNNQLSKAVLMLSIEKLTEKFPEKCFYFPAYEIVMDELRDYRFYDRDMCHVSEQGIEHVRKIFIQALMEPRTQEIIKEVESLNLAKKHRPLHENTSLYKKFIESINKKEALLNKLIDEQFMY
ncbi:MAG: GSCFA domain-containing protein [Prevotellaceae bacterium]|jgi:hypothetical protein|nr:GSCFA domain-containing protein [Prevotellaceae bacterium]